MRGIATVLSVLVIGLAAAGCQSPSSVVGALQPMPYSVTLMGTPAMPMPVSTPMPAGTPVAETPEGFISFCLRFSDQCKAEPSQIAQVTVTLQTWHLLNRVNNLVNTNIAPEDDMDHYGRAEYWTIPKDGYGDCEDYALAKRQALIAAGLPELALRVAVVLVPDGARHAVLTVATDNGDYVLDNLRTSIVPWTATGYRWIQRQAANSPMDWVSLQSNGIVPPFAVAENRLTPAPEIRASEDRVAVLTTSAVFNRGMFELPTAASP